MAQIKFVSGAKPGSRISDTSRKLNILDAGLVEKAFNTRPAASPKRIWKQPRAGSLPKRANFGGVIVMQSVCNAEASRNINRHSDRLPGNVHSQSVRRTHFRTRHSSKNGSHSHCYGIDASLTAPTKGFREGNGKNLASRCFMT